MMSSLDPSVLLRHVERRLAASGTTLAAFQAGAAADEAADASRLAAVVVVKSFVLESFAAGARALVARTGEPLRREWYRAFTRAIFLAGDPARLATRFAFDPIAPDGSCAWLAPAPAGRRETLRRLLKPLRTEGALPVGGWTAVGPEGGRRLRLSVATGGLRLEHYLIHLHHVLCEASIEGELRPEDHLAIGHVPELRGLPLSPLHVRVHRDPAGPDRLRLYAVLEHAEQGNHE